MLKRSLVVIGVALFSLALSVSTFAQSTAVGVVTASQLNVRTLPDPIDGVAITRVFQNQQYTVIGRDATANWFQIQLPDGNTGWVSSAYFRVINFAGVPITNTDFVQGRVLSQRLNLRQQPTTASRSLGQISRGQVYRVVGKNADSSWFQVRLPSGIAGWVTGQWLYVTDPARVPVISTATPAPAVNTGNATNTNNVVTSGTVNGTVTAFFLNVRTLPDPVEGIDVGTVAQGQVFNVVGRDATTNWFQIQLGDGNTGWVSSAYLRVPNPGAVPVTFSGYVQGTVLSARLNIRLAPNAVNGRIIGQISRGQVYRVLARSTNGWYEIRLPDGITGWVNGQYLRVTDVNALPVK